jgi:hypothetical protein
VTVSKEILGWFSGFSPLGTYSSSSDWVTKGVSEMDYGEV